MRLPLFLFFTCSFVHLFGQTYTVKGLVQDKRTGNRLANVNVYVPNSRVGTVSDINGIFEFPLVVRNKTDEVLEITVAAKKTGYKRFSAPANFKDKTEIAVVIQLEEDLFYDDEEIITDFSVVNHTRKNLGYGVDYIPTKDVHETHARNLSDLFKTHLSNAFVLGSNGYTNSGSHLFLRGSTSFFGHTSPAIYIDGIKFDSDLVSGGFSVGGSTINRLHDIQIETIDKIEVLRGPVASAIYGSEGANGVIQIITKNGQPGLQQFTFNSQVDMKQLSSDDFPSKASRQLLTGQQKKSNVYSSSLSMSGGQQDYQYFLHSKFLTNQGLLDLDQIEGVSLTGNFNVRISNASGFNLKSIYSRQLFNRALGENSSAGPLSTTIHTPDSVPTGKALINLQSSETQQETYKYTSSLRYYYSPETTSQLDIITGFDITEQDDVLKFSSFGDKDDSFRSNRRQSRIFTTRMNYQNRIELSKALKLNLLLGTNYNFRSLKRAETSVKGEVPSLEIQTEAAFLTPLEKLDHEDKTLGVYAKGNLILNRLTTFDLGVRYDKTSFNTSEYTNIFPHISANHIFELNTKDYIKGFAGYGTAGRLLQLNESVDYAVYTSKNMELVSEMEAGIEATLFNAQYKAKLSYFNKSTTNAYVLNTQNLNDRSIESTGELSSKGIEFSLTGYVFRNEDWSYFAKFGLTSVTDEVLKTTADNQPIIVGALNSINGGSAIIQKGGASPELYLQTKEGDRVIGSKAGKILPDLYGSLSHQVNYGQFRFDALMDFAYGHNILNLTKYQRMYHGNDATTSDLLYPASGVEKADWFKIRELSFSYELPIDKRTQTSLNISFAIQNVVTFSDYSGLDPETHAFSYGFYSNNGIDFNSLPDPRTYSIRVQFKL